MNSIINFKPKYHKKSQLIYGCLLWGRNVKKINYKKFLINSFPISKFSLKTIEYEPNILF